MMLAWFFASETIVSPGPRQAAASAWRVDTLAW